MMQDWMLPNITDYWDERVEAIERLSRVLAEVPEADRLAHLKSIVTAVTRHATALSDADLVKYAVPIVEDLYKALAKSTYYDDPLRQYLAATGSPYFHALTARGYMVHYFIDNTWDRLDGPVIGFPIWFRAAGLFYICPQEIACSQFEKDQPREKWPALVSKYIDDGRSVADRLAHRCHAEGRHFVYLDIDATDFEIAIKLGKGPGVIFVFRQEAPNPGSRCAVNLPAGPRTAQVSTDAPAAASGSTQTPTQESPRANAAPSASDLVALLGTLRAGDSETRRIGRTVLRDQITEILAGATAESNLSVVKATLASFRDEGWELVRSDVQEGFYTVADAIQAVLDAIERNPLAKALLPIVIDDRVRSVTGSPAAKTPNPIPSFATLLKAVKRGQEINKPDREGQFAAPAAQPAPAAASAPASGGTTKLKPLIDGLVGGDEDSRRSNRRALAAALSEALTDAADLDALKPDVLAFRDAGWALIRYCNYGEGEYTLAAALRALIGVIPRRPQLKSWLPLIVEPRLKLFMQHPVADSNMAAWSTLDGAMDEAAKFDVPG
jgi:hypothetical protein